MLWKVLLTVAVVIAVWFGFRYAERLGAQRERERVGRRRQRRAERDESPPQVEDLVECRVCGAFVGRDTVPCDRRDCPFA